MIKEWFETLENRNHKIQNKIEHLEAQLEKAKKQRWKYNSYNSVIVPLAKALCQELQMKYFEIYGPFGVCCETSIYMSNECKSCKDHTKKEYGKEANIDICHVDTYSITLEYGGELSGLKYRTGEVRDTYAKGTIGELNGMNDVYADLPNDLDEIVKIIKKQAESKEG